MSSVAKIGEVSTLENRIGAILKYKGMTVTTAESCTGGLVAATLVDEAGISEVFQEGYITYSNEAKEKLLQVKHETLEQYGAVSKETAAEMAIGAAHAAGADVAISVTGIAGPDGGSAAKPVGLVYIGCHMRGRTSVKCCNFKGSRKEIRKAAVKEALEILYCKLLAL